ncbi:MAG TPA: hypothetical protein PLI95_23650, partial [Polyangiaceae bacterium]|nr:hypothetical protein [Polyangiaceae bacterium]
MKPTTLTIRLAGGGQPPTAEQTFCDLHVGGPDTLLSWLETQLGLRQKRLDHCTLVAQFQGKLMRCTGSVFAQSLEADAWATAAELLSRREELRLAGWDESDHPSLPRLVRDLAGTADPQAPLDDDSDRLTAILAALDKGQVLPPHECFLEDAPESWPLKWRPLLARLNLRQPVPATPRAPAKSALREAQTHCLHGSTGPLQPDASLRWIGTRSIVGACEAVGACLAADPDNLASTVVCCANPTAAVQLDGVLERLGLPTMGAGIKTREHPALQVLPLVLRLCWSPVDPSTLLDFLSLPVGPIKPRWGRKLADALGQQPGFGSRAWEEAVKELAALEGEEGQKAAERIQKWFGIERAPWGKPLPHQLVKSCCSRVAQWAAGYAALDGLDPVLASALRLAAGQAATLGELVEGRGEEVSEPQLARMLDSAMASGVTVQPLAEGARGPILVASLADVPECKRLVWLGLACDDGRGHRWTHQEREALRARGIELDDGSAWTASQRRAERVGLSRVGGALLAVSLPDDQNQRPHPVWLQILSGLEKTKTDKAVALDQLLTSKNTKEIAPWVLRQTDAPIDPAQPARAVWKVPAKLL